MRLAAFAALAIAAACSHGDPTPAPPKPSEPLPMRANAGTGAWGATDLVTAISDDWSSTKVTLARWTRDQGTVAWKQVGTSWPGVIGHTGAAWGAGLHGTGAPEGRDGPVKHEGDGASPAGAFEIASAFGYERWPAIRLPYTQLVDTTECVDDPKSVAYNTIVEHTGSADWTSSEHMHRPDGLYELGAVVEHNPKRTPGAGSCIFLHVWSGPDSTTVGCTAMDHDRLAALLADVGNHAV